MAILNIRNLPKEVHARLRLRAARAGRSMEAEARTLLASACMTELIEPVKIQEWVARLYGGKKPRHAVEALIAGRRRDAKKE